MTDHKRRWSVPRPLDRNLYSSYDNDRAAASTAAALVGRQMSNNSNRRKFLGTAAGAAAFTILPRRLLARSPEVPPSDKITLAYIGTGTQGLRELLPLLAAPEIQVVSVCD